MATSATFPSNQTLQDDPSTPCQQYNDMFPNWELIQALMGGTPKMRDKGQKYLPKEPGEDNPIYENRLNRTVLYNGFKRTVTSLVGKPFTKEVTITKPPEEFLPWLENIDRAGRNVNMFLRDIFTDVICYGMGVWLVDYPAKPAENAAQERELDIRPYWVQINPLNLIGWQSEIRNGVEVLTQVRIREYAMVPDGQFKVRRVERIRVYEIGKWTLYEKDDKRQTQEMTTTTWAQVDQGVTTLNEIPLVVVYGYKKAFMVCEPPLVDLAWLNVEHWQSTSDQRNILHIARVPIMFGAGWSDPAQQQGAGSNGTLIIGPSRMITSPDKDAKLTFVEHTGAAIGAGRTDIQDIEARMAMLGTQLLYKKTQGGDTTATEENNDQKAEESDLKAMSRNLEGGAELGLRFMCDWLKMDPEKAGSVEVFKDYDDEPANSDMNILMQLQQQGFITRETLMKEAQRREILSPSIDIDEELAAAASAGPTPEQEMHQANLEATYTKNGA